MKVGDVTVDGKVVGTIELVMLEQDDDTMHVPPHGLTDPGFLDWGDDGGPGGSHDMPRQSPGSDDVPVKPRGPRKGGGPTFRRGIGPGSKTKKDRDGEEEPRRGGPTFRRGIGPGSQSHRPPAKPKASDVDHGHTKDQDGRHVDPGTMQQLTALAARKDTAAMRRLMHAKGYRVDSQWCGDLAHAIADMEGYPSPSGYPVASNWRRMGPGLNPQAINEPGRHFGSIVMSKTNTRIGSTGGHVAQIVPGTYDPNTNTAVVIDTHGKWRRSLRGFEVHSLGGTSNRNVAESQPSRTSSVPTPAERPAAADRLAERRTDRPIADQRDPFEPIARRAPPSAVQDGSGLRDERAGFSRELESQNVRSRLYRLTQLENPADPQAFMESIMNRAAARHQTLDRALSDRGYYPDSLAKMDRGGGTSFNADEMRSVQDRVLAGSNKINYATGNASLTTGFGYGHRQNDPYTYRDPRTGERYGIENQKSDIAWAARVRENERRNVARLRVSSVSRSGQAIPTPTDQQMWDTIKGVMGIPKVGPNYPNAPKVPMPDQPRAAPKEVAPGVWERQHPPIEYWGDRALDALGIPRTDGKK